MGWQDAPILEQPQAQPKWASAPAFDEKPANKLTPAQEFANEHPIQRTIGRTARAGLTGLSSLADLGLLVPKTAALAGSMAADKMGFADTAQTLEKWGNTPTMADTTRGIIDRATGNKLQPTGAIDKIGDFTGEMIASAVPFVKGAEVVDDIAKGPNIGSAVKSVLDPETALNQLPAIQKAQAIPRPTSDTVRKASSATYQKATELGGLLKPEATDSWLDNVGKQVMPQTSAGRIVAGADTPVAKVMQRIEGLRGQPLSLDEFQEIDEILGEAIDGEFGIKGLSKQGKKILDIQNSFRDMLENADESMVAGTKEGFEALKEARGLWAKNMKMRDIERIITRAEMSDQPANAMRAGFKTLYNNPNRIKGYSKAEKELIRQGAQDSIPMELLRGTASRLTGIVSGAVGGPKGFVVGKGLEMGARGIREKVAGQKAQGIVDLISGYSAPKTFDPLLTPKGGLTAIAGTNNAGQKLLAPPEPVSRNAEIAKYLTAPATSTVETQTNTVLPTLNTPMRTPETFLDRVAMAESGGNPNAKAKTSSASGMYQFTDPTWRGMVKNYGAQTGITEADKNDPDKQKIMAELLTQENTQAYNKAGIQPDDADLYMAHFLGGPSAVKARKNLNAVGAELFPAAAQANKNIFYKNGRPRTVEEIRGLLGSKVGV